MPLFDWGFFFDIEVHKLFVCFGDKFLMDVFFANISYVLRVVFFFVFMVSSALPSLLRGIQSQLFIFHDSNRWVKREFAAFYVKAYSAFFPQEFHIIILLFRSLLGVYFCVCC